MPRPERLSAADVLCALSLTPEKPSVLAKQLQVSRATLHRKMESLLAEKLVVRVGTGPAAAYRRPSPLDALASARSETSTDGQVRLTMGRAAARALQEGLECYSRIGIGQLEQITEVMRDKCYGKDPVYTQDELDEAKALVQELKERLLGFERGASYSIHGSRVDPKVRRAWALQRAVRHRLAWDHHPKGGYGVSHDEPLPREALPGLFVHSDSPGSEGGCARYVVEMPFDCVQLLIESLTFAVRLRSGDVKTVLELVKDQILLPRADTPLTDSPLLEGTYLVARLTALITKRGFEDRNLKLDASGARMLQVLKALQGYNETMRRESAANGDEPAVVVESVDSSPWAVNVEGMPDEMMLNFNKGSYRVIAPSKTDGMLVIVASSYSLKTAVQMAKNYAEGGAARARDF
jgi:hypothetical protein